MFFFTTQAEALSLRREGKRVVNVSSHAPPPYRYLSPFYPHGGIPIPGMLGKTADSVEGVWQGLKIIRGNIDESLFHGRGKKRRGRPNGHLYGDEVLDYLQARKLIYIPVYRWMLYHVPLARETAFDLLREGEKKEIYFYDFEVNPDVRDLSKPLAHAAVLAELLNENLRIWRRFQENEKFRREYDEEENGEPEYMLADLWIREKEGKVVR